MRNPRPRRDNLPLGTESPRVLISSCYTLDGIDTDELTRDIDITEEI